MLKILSSLFNRVGVSHQVETQAVIDGNQERPLPQRWRDPAPKPARQPLFGHRGE